MLHNNAFYDEFVDGTYVLVTDLNKILMSLTDPYKCP